MTPFDVGRFALLWGPGILILVVFSYGFLRLAYHWIDRTTEVKRRQMESALEAARTYFEQFVGAQKSQADAFTRLASAVERRDSQESFEHQEMLIAIKVMREQLEALGGRRRGKAVSRRVGSAGVSPASLRPEKVCASPAGEKDAAKPAPAAEGRGIAALPRPLTADR